MSSWLSALCRSVSSLLRTWAISRTSSSTWGTGQRLGRRQSCRNMSTEARRRFSPENGQGDYPVSRWSSIQARGQVSEQFRNDVNRRVVSDASSISKRLCSHCVACPVSMGSWIVNFPIQFLPSYSPVNRNCLDIRLGERFRPLSLSRLSVCLATALRGMSGAGNRWIVIGRRRSQPWPH